MAARAELPANVSLYTGPNRDGLVDGSIFTRLVTTAADAPTLSRALASEAAFPAFLHQHGLSVLISDDGHDQDLHHDHFRRVCLCLKDHGDIGLAFGQCVFDAGAALETGFQMERLDGGAIMVVDLRHGDEDDDPSPEDDTSDEDNSGLEEDADHEDAAPQ